MRSPTNIILACIAAFDMSSLIIQAPWYDIFLLDEEIVFCSFQAFLHLQPGPPLSAPGDQGGVLHHGAMCGYHSLHVPHNSKLAYTGALRYGWRVKYQPFIYTKETLFNPAQRYIYICKPYLTKHWCTVKKTVMGVSFAMLLSIAHVVTRTVDRTYTVWTSGEIN